MTEPDTENPKGIKRRRLLKGAGITALAATIGLEGDSEVSGIICPEGVNPDFFGLFAENGMTNSFSTVSQLCDDPASRSSLITLCLASYSETQADTGTVKGNQTGLNIKFTELQDGYAEKELAQFPNRASLRNITIQDPENPQNTIHLDMIAHHRDPATSLNVCVFYEKTMNNLIFVCPGVDKLSDMFEVNDTVAGRVDPADSQIKNLMTDVLQQIEQRRLPVEHMTIFGHSLGAGPATEILAQSIHAQSIHDPEYKRLLNIKPKVAFIEEWKATETAQNIAAHSGWPGVDKLSGYITSVRRVPGTFTAQPDNPVLGKSARAVVPGNLWQLITSDQLTARQLGHEESDIAEDLFVKRDKLVETTPAVLNQIQPTALFRIADMIWRANVRPDMRANTWVNEGLTAAALAKVGADKWSDRRQKVQAENAERRARKAEAGAEKKGEQGGFRGLIARHRGNYKSGNKGEPER